MTATPDERALADQEAFDRYVLPELEVMLRVAMSITRNPADAAHRRRPGTGSAQVRLLRRHRMGDRPLSCKEVGRVLQRYLDGETDDEVTRKVAEHLEDCRRCGLELTVYSEIKGALARQAPTLPDDTLDRLRQFGEQLANEPPDHHEHGNGDGDGEAG